MKIVAVEERPTEMLVRVGRGMGFWQPSLRARAEITAPYILHISKASVGRPREDKISGQRNSRCGGLDRLRPSSDEWTGTTPPNTGNIVLDLKGDVKGEAVIVGQGSTVVRIAVQLKQILSAEEIGELVDRLQS